MMRMLPNIEAKPHRFLQICMIFSLGLQPTLGDCQEINVFTYKKTSIDNNSNKNRAVGQVGVVKKISNVRAVLDKKINSQHFWHGYMLTEDGQEHYWVDGERVDGSYFKQSSLQLQWMCAKDDQYCPAHAVRADF